MDCFIKKIWEGKGEEAHYQFVRFSKGRFEGRAVLNLWRTGKIKLRGSFEWANDFVVMASELIDKARISGIVLSKENLSDMMSQNNIQGNSESKKKGLFYKNNIEGQELTNEQIKKLVENSYTCLLDIEGTDIVLKTKKKLPKPGKSEGKVDDKFCHLELDLKYWPVIKEAFKFPECKKCKVSHIFEIEQIILPETDEKDFAKIRELAKRRGKIIRKINVDSRESEEEVEFVA